ncbi:MAG: hypothetical protein V4591_01630 [Bdellovibrionota bacterium]
MDKKTLEEINKILAPRMREFFPDGKVQGKYLVIPSPFREDKNPDSFKISLYSDEPFWYDHATKEGGNITSLLERAKGLSLDYLLDKYLPQAKNKSEKLIKTKTEYEYKSSTGNKSAFIHRFDWIENGERKKKVTPYSFSNGKWNFNADGFEKPRALFNMDKLSLDKKILIVEGEKTCVFAQKLLGDEFVVLTWPFGASSVHLANWDILKLYKNNFIYVWPDNDKEGLRAANYLGDLLGEFIRIIEVSQLNLPKGWDLANIGDLDPEMNREFTKQEVLDILYAAKPYQKRHEDKEKIEIISTEMIEKLDEEFLEKEDKEATGNKIDYNPHPSLEKYVNYVDILPKVINETNETTVTIDKKGNIIGHSVSSVILFCIDYFNAGKDLHQSNRIALLSMDGKLKLRKYKQIKEDGVKKIVIVEESFYLNDGNYSKSIEFYNQSVINYNIHELKKRLKHNGVSYADTKKIFSTLSKYFTKEAEIAAVILIHFIVQVKLKLHNRHSEIQLHMAPVFCSEKQKNGKSTFMRKFCSPFTDFYAEKLPEDFVDVRNWKELCSNFINGSDDINQIKGNIMSIWKGMITSNILH